ncbi:hypothetical protein ABC304_01380 [Microbacterium sp. 1P10UB]|uniref:hypothetical protein n=1 Tax=unclassified Microbacterium TaxID=2609290 RepID=UPI0039A23703
MVPSADDDALRERSTDATGTPFVEQTPRAAAYGSTSTGSPLVDTTGRGATSTSAPTSAPTWAPTSPPMPAPPREPATRAAQRAAGRALNAEPSTAELSPQVLWAPPPKRRRRRGLIWGIVIAAVLLVAAGVVAFLLYQNARAAAEASGAAAAASVEDYFTAIASGDAATALTFVDGAPTGGLLTDDALAASAALAPLTGISATSDPIWGDSGQVRVSYVLGGRPVTAAYDVTDIDGDAVWTIADVPEVQLGSRLAGLPVLLAGVPFTNGTIDAFPGTYPATMGGDVYTVAADATVTVTGPQEATVGPDVVPSLTDAGVQAYRTAVASAVNTCLASRALASGCGLDLPPTLSDGTTLYDGTVFRTLTPEAQAGLAAVVPELDPTQSALAESGMIGAVAAAANCTQGQANGECDIVDAPALTGATVDLTQSTPAVTWR